jgi:hypothetical protein
VVCFIELEYFVKILDAMRFCRALGSEVWALEVTKHSACCCLLIMGWGFGFRGSVFKFNVKLGASKALDFGGEASRSRARVVITCRLCV